MFTPTDFVRDNVFPSNWGRFDIDLINCPQPDHALELIQQTLYEVSNYTQAQLALEEAKSARDLVSNIVTTATSGGSTAEHLVRRPSLLPGVVRYHIL